MSEKDLPADSLYFCPDAQNNLLYIISRGKCCIGYPDPESKTEVIDLSKLYAMKAITQEKIDYQKENAGPETSIDFYTFQYIQHIIGMFRHSILESMSAGNDIDYDGPYLVVDAEEK